MKVIFATDKTNIAANQYTTINYHHILSKNYQHGAK